MVQLVYVEAFFSIPLRQGAELFDTPSERTLQRKCLLKIWE
jgi:hypothetical protein